MENRLGKKLIECLTNFSNGILVGNGASMSNCQLKIPPIFPSGTVEHYQMPD